MQDKKPQKAHLQEHWHPKESGAVHESDDVDSDLYREQDNPRQKDADRLQREHIPHALAPSVVVLHEGAEHGQGGQAHDTGDVHLEAEAEGREVVLVDEPLESEEEDRLDDELAKVLKDHLWKKAFVTTRNWFPTDS